MLGHRLTPAWGSYVKLEPVEPAADFEAAARSYRRCRRRGVTPRGPFHCMVAAVALRTDATLLAQDIDLQRIADLVGIVMDTA